MQRGGQKMGPWGWFFRLYAIGVLLFGAVPAALIWCLSR